MTKYQNPEGQDMLSQAIMALKTPEECQRFLDDLCTVAERRAMNQRVEVAMRLHQGQIYRDILEETGASSATISRVNRCLHYGADGYKTVIARIEESNR